MADLNYVSPLTSDLTDYYTKTEVDELQQGDENRFATQAQITAGDNEVKGWVASQGYLTQHQSLQNYATKSYVDAAIEDIEVEGGVKIRVVSNLPANPETNVIYLTRRSSEEDDNVYNEWIYVEDIDDFELIGDTSTGVLPDLTDYATKSYVDTAVAAIDIPTDAEDIAYDNTDSGLGSTDVQAAIDEICDNIPSAIGNEIDAFSATLAAVATSGDYDDLSNKPTIPSLTGYATQTYVNDAVAAVVVPTDAEDIAFDNTETGLQATNVQTAIDELAGNTFADLNSKANISDLAAVATSGSYNDLTDKPTIPDVSSLTAEDIGYSNPDRYTHAQNITNVKRVINFIENALDGKVSSSSLATVATSGDYDDLTNKPTIPSVSGLATETYVDNAVAAITVPTKVSDLDNDMNFVDEPMAKSFAIDEINNNVSAAGLSGSYNDLDDKPTIPTVPTNVSSFTNDAGYLTSHQDISGKANIADLATVATSGDYDDLTNKPTIPSISGLATETYVNNAVAGISVPANTSDLTNDSGFITSSDLPDTSGFVESSDLATVATTGDYDDLTNKPTIPVLPTLATVATSGSYNDLSDKPTIPTSGIDGVGNGSLASLLMLLSGVNDNDTRAMLTVNPTTIAEFEEAFKKGILIYLYGRNLDITSSQFSSTNGFTWYQFNNASKTYSPRTTTVNSLGNANYYLKLTDNTGLSVFQGNQGYGTEGLRKAIFKYVNTTSGLTATTFQEAIDELAASGGSSVGYTYDSTTKTVSLSGVSDDNL